ASGIGARPAGGLGVFRRVRVAAGSRPGRGAVGTRTVCTGAGVGLLSGGRQWTIGHAPGPLRTRTVRQSERARGARQARTPVGAAPVAATGGGSAVGDGGRARRGVAGPGAAACGWQHKAAPIIARAPAHRARVPYLRRAAYVVRGWGANP